MWQQDATRDAMWVPFNSLLGSRLIQGQLATRRQEFQKSLCRRSSTWRTPIIAEWRRTA
jgi:hypothetical protein